MNNIMTKMKSYILAFLVLITSSLLVSFFYNIENQPQEKSTNNVIDNAISNEIEFHLKEIHYNVQVLDKYTQLSNFISLNSSLPYQYNDTLATAGLALFLEAQAKEDIKNSKIYINKLTENKYEFSEDYNESADINKSITNLTYSKFKHEVIIEAKKRIEFYTDKILRTEEKSHDINNIEFTSNNVDMLVILRNYNDKMEVSSYKRDIAKIHRHLSKIN